jgi:hypothetical protein
LIQIKTRGKNPAGRTDEFLKKPKSKNYQDDKDKEGDRRNSGSFATLAARRVRGLLVGL